MREVRGVCGLERESSAAPWTTDSLVRVQYAAYYGMTFEAAQAWLVSSSGAGPTYPPADLPPPYPQAAALASQAADHVAVGAGEGGGRGAATAGDVGRVGEKDGGEDAAAATDAAASTASVTVAEPADAAAKEADAAAEEGLHQTEAQDHAEAAKSTVGGDDET